MTSTRRLRECVERWPECETSAYDPRCCRFPKSCSASVYGDETDESLLEPVVTSVRPEDPAETARWVAEQATAAFRDAHGHGNLQILPSGPFDMYPPQSLIYFGAGPHGSRAIYHLDGDNLDPAQMQPRDRALAVAVLRFALSRLEAK